MAKRSKPAGLLQRKSLRERQSNTFFKKWFGVVNLVPAPPKNRHLADYRPHRGTRLPSLRVTLIDELLAIAIPGTFTSEPEAIVAGWLTKNDVPFTSQEQFGGGRLPGGTVVDFIITLNPRQPKAVRVQSYWHNTAEAKFFDDVQKAEILASGFEVYDIWEYEIRDSNRLDTKMWEIVLGVNR